MLREGMSCARSHTKKWCLEDFNQVRLPRADFPAGSGWAGVSRLQWAWVMLTLACSHVLSPRVGDLASGRNITACSLPLRDWPPGC